MARDEEPVLARQDTDPNAGEEEGLLGGGQVQREGARGWKFWREVGVFAWAVVATVAVIILGVAYQHQHEKITEPPIPNGKRNLIFMVSDGMGPTSLSLTRSYMQYAQGLPYSSHLVLDTHLIGSSRTRSTSSLVTDSAAGATAFSCGLKSYNGAISVLDDYTPCGTVLEAAKKAGYMTGLVVTTRITDATPACFASHVNIRDEEDRIAEQYIGDYPLGRVVDLFMGGGRCHFLPNSTNASCRQDDKDIIATAKQRGFTYASSRADFDDLKGGESVSFPFLGLFADTDIPYEIDRRAESHIYPSLDEMATTAMKALSKATETNEKGFFLMIEGSRIDHAGHANDPAAQVHEVLAYDKAFASVIDFLEHEVTPGVMVSTSDHETGGLATARRKLIVLILDDRLLTILLELNAAYPEYRWFPEVFANVTNSAEAVTREYMRHRQINPSDDMTAYSKKLVQKRLGVSDVSADEISLLVKSPDTAAYTFADIISRRSQTGWSTHGHSGNYF
jgi:alkaline phosphatase